MFPDSGEVKDYQQHIVVPTGGLQGCALYLFFFFFFFFVVLLFSFGKNVGPGFLWGPTRLLAEACSPLLWSMCFAVALGFLRRSSSRGDCQWEPPATLSGQIWNTATSRCFASLNAKQHGVRLCWLGRSRGLPPPGRHPAADQAGMHELSRGWRIRGRGCVWI